MSNPSTVSSIENDLSKSQGTIVQQDKEQALKAKNETSISSKTNGPQTSFGKNRFVHFERGDRIIYEPNDVHQLKYINDKGEVSPITGV